MISDQDRKLVQDIFLHIEHPGVHREVMEDPEAYHRSLLNTIKRELSERHNGVLRMTVESACYGDHLKEAREELNEELNQPVSQE